MLESSPPSPSSLQGVRSYVCVRVRAGWPQATHRHKHKNTHILARSILQTAIYVAHRIYRLCIKVHTRYTGAVFAIDECALTLIHTQIHTQTHLQQGPARVVELALSAHGVRLGI